MNKFDNPLFQTIFLRKLSEYQLSELELSDYREVVRFIFYQGLRPMRRSDSIAAAYTSLALFEGVHERLVKATDEALVDIQVELAKVENA